MSAESGPLYLGFDLSTQQLKGIVVSSSLKKAYEAQVGFDADFPKYGISKGVLSNDAAREVFAPVAMWLEALDLVLERLKGQGLDFSRVKGISGAGQQHGSVYWSAHAEKLLAGLNKDKNLAEQLAPQAFSHPNSPNWQDASTQKECDAFDELLGTPEKLADLTGSKAHHRFTGPQIFRFNNHYPDAYRATARISLVSSFLASLFLGKVAPFDISDVTGMNLWNIKAGAWNEDLLALTAGKDGAEELKKKLGDVPEDGGGSWGPVHKYFVERYGFNPACVVTPFTGDNPSTILALPLRANDAMVSLGTSTTFLMSTPKYKPDPAYHFMNHPTTPGLYMFMLCYKNGGLAREKVRNAINEKHDPRGASTGSWEKYDHIAAETPALGQKGPNDAMKMGLYFPRPEIVPNVAAGEWHFNYDLQSKKLEESESGWNHPDDDARAIIESQMLSLRLRSEGLVEAAGDLPPQPRRVYLVGGGSKNPTLAKIAGEILGGAEGIYRLDVGDNACALGSAYKAVWAVERNPGQTFEQLIGSRWDEAKFVKKIADGYRKELFELYGHAVKGFDQVEKRVLEQQKA
ncbi:xylulose kinase [Xylona heveae TC161]|uniref:Xylulose kinase n=1 Tax=Xylona heveae (strain CBS 132557 / TC161) TaxID=1328760 RepID=A0A165ILF6_XYLHT|nr:xylulose kinase [Xylona heveae TC161]KZF25064.1 xylulose kinase [Xylona heveae TC161]